MTPVARVTSAPHRELGGTVLRLHDLTKRYGSEVAVQSVSLDVRRGSFYGIVGPNGAGKTTTLSMATGLLKPTSGTVEVLGIDVWENAAEARSRIGILPDRLRLFDQLTGGQLLYYTGVLRGLDDETARARTASLIQAFEFGAAANRLVVDYSAGMTKKIALASALIHSPELLVLDEPFESIDPVSAVQLTDILFDYVSRGGTVILSSHSMDLVQRVCDHVAVIVDGEILADGTVDAVRGDITLEERFRDIVRGPQRTEGLDWLGISFN
ncbi:ABC transporter ATP-binding protein [Pseudoclavibacter chungangensis]|uniref:ABC transporter ATP-binding protein n=2 Tax=Pseudoclavibacter chungangensis TaxID=587635 RepID=A0A7J5BQH6_9MICO|nr:ABC transporter ATP-binding protein [Pseudoclavibacter chungangensis]KAB1655129.1 ABC transporter ATP-binding protein [Pseudoclavibacter chungangensis]